jgi:hypothetical protein
MSRVSFMSASLYAAVGGPTDRKAPQRAVAFPIFIIFTHILCPICIVNSELGAVRANLLIHCAHQ